ncbi:putative L-PSP endoribonuclease family protein [Xylaria cf. heliscus]|nr:putative L-PSP endoribonuclease family protein [Xylaria cf. heliscus]
MADLKYYNYPGLGVESAKTYSYSQAARIGDTIQVSGQGGWNPNGPLSSCSRDLPTQIDKAFENVELALKTAGGKGWSQVYSVKSYHVPLNNEALEIVSRNFRKWCPDHQPLWTAVGVQRLADDDMRIEIEVQAYDPEGAKKA